MGPDLQGLVQQLVGQRVALLAPVVLRGLGLSLAFVRLQRFVEEVAAVEGMLAQHALAPGVDGVDGRVVHAFGRHGQAPGRAFTGRAFRVGLAQRVQEAVVGRRFGLATKALHGLDQAPAYAIRQLARGRAREGHDEDVGRHQRPLEGRAADAVQAALAMPQHQAQVERGDGPGLAGAGAGLDQAAAPQREALRVEHMAGHVAVHIAGRGADHFARAHCASPGTAGPAPARPPSRAAARGRHGPGPRSAHRRPRPRNRDSSGPRTGPRPRRRPDDHPHRPAVPQRESLRPWPSRCAAAGAAGRSGLRATGPSMHAAVPARRKGSWAGPAPGRRAPPRATRPASRWRPAPGCAGRPA